MDGGVSGIENGPESDGADEGREQELRDDSLQEGEVRISSLQHGMGSHPSHCGSMTV